MILDWKFSSSGNWLTLGGGVQPFYHIQPRGDGFIALVFLRGRIGRLARNLSVILDGGDTILASVEEAKARCQRHCDLLLLQ